MAEKQSIIGRITQLTKANINSILDKAEDPGKMIDQLIRDYTNQIAEAEQAVVQTIGNLRLAEQDYNEDVAAAQQWGAKALAASKQGDVYRTQGDAANADKFDNLAKLALGKQIQAETEVREAEPRIVAQRDTVATLKTGLATMKDKLADLKSRRDTLVARQKSAEAQQAIHGAISSINVLDPTSEISRFEEQVRREEAKALGQAELAASSIDSQFAELEASSGAVEIETRLAQLKSGGTNSVIDATPVTPQIEN